jgi:hypothetical protein
MKSALSGGHANGNQFLALAIFSIGMIWRKEYFSSQDCRSKAKIKQK